ncbi:hypothetical protein [Methylobacterium nigriterrae]|uniref:hypothetical protein n=1 Tax=Methylobacterium nigriterrae TaxID=3127512 RepID=UPI003013E04F
MSIPTSAESRYLSHDEFAIVSDTHYPGIATVSAEELRETRKRLRGLHDKAKTFSRQLRRAARGKASLRGSSFPGDMVHPSRRKQIFAQAIKRVSREINRLVKQDAKASLTAAARRALDLKRQNRLVHHPSADRRERTGMRSSPSDRRSVTIEPSEIGRVSQANKVSQAKRDA